MTTLKIWISYLYYYSGLLRLVRYIHNRRMKRVTIVVFHRVKHIKGKDSGLPTLYVTPETFNDTIEYLERHYHIISLKEFCDKSRKEKILPPNTLVVTFDDGYLDIYENAFPLLRKRGIPFTVFLPSDILHGQVDFWWDRVYNGCVEMDLSQFLGRLENLNIDLPLLVRGGTVPVAATEVSAWDALATDLVDYLGNLPNDERDHVIRSLLTPSNVNGGDNGNARNVVNMAEIQEMIDGGCEIGSHTQSHCFLDSVSPSVALREIQDSKILLEKYLGKPIRHFAYPAGRWSRSIRNMVEIANYDSGCVSEEGVNRVNEDLMLLKRVNISESLITDRRGKFCMPLLATRLTIAEYISKWHEYRNQRNESKQRGYKI